MDTEINSKINFFPEKFLKKKIQFLLIAGRIKLAQIVIKDHFGHVTPNRENKMTYKNWFFPTSKAHTNYIFRQQTYIVYFN
jgi:hypothetical protein